MIMRPRDNINKDEYCIYDGRLLNDLGYGEYYCKECGRFFKNGREIEYTEDGDIVYKINTAKKGKKHTKKTDRNNRRTWSEIESEWSKIEAEAKENIYNWNDLINKIQGDNDLA